MMTNPTKLTHTKALCRLAEEVMGLTATVARRRATWWKPDRDPAQALDLLEAWRKVDKAGRLYQLTRDSAGHRVDLCLPNNEYSFNSPPSRTFAEAAFAAVCAAQGIEVKPCQGWGPCHRRT
jgi:hypothetical protein